jgi:glycosyltransferase involved in cell wall biosynthesis
MINKTEEDIRRRWKNKESIVVSVNCVTYNHEYCLEEALDSFLMQDTDFAFEILIHDDVSTDGTANIMRQYEEKYPNIVKPIYQTENQFAKNINPMSLLYKKVQGKYMAFCDGDDFWTDSKKLSIQVGEMEKHPHIDFSFHPVYELINGNQGDMVSKHSNQNTIFSTQEVISRGGEFCPTGSLMFRSRLLTELPDWFKEMIPGDYPMQIVASLNAGALYIDKCMAIYRIGEVGAWSNLAKEDYQKKKTCLYDFHDMLNKIDEYLDYQFHQEFQKLVHKSSLNFIKARIIDVEVRREVFDNNKNVFSFKDAMAWFILYKNKSFYDTLSAIKHKVQSVFV